MLSRKKEEIIKVIKELTKEVRKAHPKVENFNSKKVALGNYRIYRKIQEQV